MSPLRPPYTLPPSHFFHQAGWGLMPGPSLGEQRRALVLDGLAYLVYAHTRLGELPLLRFPADFAAAPPTVAEVVDIFLQVRCVQRNGQSRWMLGMAVVVCWRLP